MRLSIFGSIPVTTTALALAGPLAAQTPYREGQPLPELRLPTIDGQRTIDLTSYRGKRLLLIEFASW